MGFFKILSEKSNHILSWDKLLILKCVRVQITDVLLQSALCWLKRL